MQLRTLFQAIRPPFLILSPVCVFLGAGTALDAQGALDLHRLMMIMIGALCAHISVNTLNEYADFKSGLDLLTVKTPFSGGSGALPADPAMANAVLATGMLALVVCCAIGIYLVDHDGLFLLAIGVTGAVIILTYTRWINHWPLLCLIAPGLGFGLLMVPGTHYALAQSLTTASWLAALVPFFLVNNLLLLNQYPDIAADRSIGRKHLPITSGTRVSSFVYSLFFLSAYLVIAAGIVSGYFPALCWIAILPVLLSVFALAGAIKHGDRIGAYSRYLGANVAATLLAPTLLGIGIIYG